MLDEAVQIDRDGSCHNKLSSLKDVFKKINLYYPSMCSNLNI